jgi:hypothetical protein
MTPWITLTILYKLYLYLCGWQWFRDAQPLAQKTAMVPTLAAMVPQGWQWFFTVNFMSSTGLEKFSPSCLLINEFHANLPLSSPTVTHLQVE